LLSLLFPLVRSRALPQHETSRRQKTTRQDGPTTRATTGAPGTAKPRRERAARREGDRPVVRSTRRVTNREDNRTSE
jgi:hypothetical protein